MAATDVSSLLTSSISELAGLIRVGELTAAEIVGAVLARIEAVDDQVNAFTLAAGESAMALAEKVGSGDPRPFAGVPIVLKDLYTPLRGAPQTQCSRLPGREQFASFDHNIVRRFKQAGFIIVGLTNSPEFGILPVTEPQLNGPTRNPWDLERTPGGSSGGAAAAVAAGMVPIAHGTDGGGSLRTPAACCGLFALKPSRGRISPAPMLGDSFLSTPGVITRTVAESALMLDLLAGYETGDANWAPPPAESFAQAAAREPASLRVGLYLRSPLGTDLDPICARAAHDAAELLTSLGHKVHEVEMTAWEDPAVPTLFRELWAIHVGSAIAATAAMAQTEPTPENIEPMSYALYERGRAISAFELSRITVALQTFARRIVAAFDEVDVLVTPSLGQRPVGIGEIDACGPEPWETFAAAGRFTPFTSVWNVTGQPAMSVPLYEGEDGLPLSVQVVGRPADEVTLFSLAAQLQTACPWPQRLAPLADPAAA
jgi:amidase